MTSATTALETKTGTLDTKTTALETTSEQLTQKTTALETKAATLESDTALLKTTQDELVVAQQNTSLTLGANLAPTLQATLKNELDLELKELSIPGVGNVSGLKTTAVVVDQVVKTPLIEADDVETPKVAGNNVIVDNLTVTGFLDIGLMRMGVADRDLPTVYQVGGSKRAFMYNPGTDPTMYFGFTSMEEDNFEATVALRNSSAYSVPFAMLSVSKPKDMWGEDKGLHGKIDKLLERMGEFGMPLPRSEEDQTAICNHKLRYPVVYEMKKYPFREGKVSKQCIDGSWYRANFMNAEEEAINYMMRVSQTNFELDLDLLPTNMTDAEKQAFQDDIVGTLELTELAFGTIYVIHKLPIFANATLALEYKTISEELHQTVLEHYPTDTTVENVSHMVSEYHAVHYRRIGMGEAFSVASYNRSDPKPVLRIRATVYKALNGTPASYWPYECPHKTGSATSVEEQTVRSRSAPGRRAKTCR